MSQMESQLNNDDYLFASTEGNETQVASDETDDNLFEELADALRDVKPPDNGGKPPELEPKPVELTDKDLANLGPKLGELLGPKAAEILLKAGVLKLNLTPGADREAIHNIQAKLKEGLEIELNPAKDGASKLKIGKDFSCDITMGKDGEILLTNIKGLKAQVDAGGKPKDIDITALTMAYNADGNAEVTATTNDGGKKGQHKFVKSFDAMTDAVTHYNKFLELIGLRCP